MHCVEYVMGMVVFVCTCGPVEFDFVFEWLRWVDVTFGLWVERVDYLLVCEVFECCERF